MTRYSALLCGASMTLALGASAYSTAFAQPTEPPAAEPAAVAPTSSSGEEVVVTANKVQQKINDVAMSVQAASGKELTKLGVTDTAQLGKIVPGFTFTPSYYGTAIYAIRGVGFQDTSLAGAPTVSVYSDEIPLPYAIMTSGAGLDVSRVEVLKGPQGVSFGSNATGGAINYIANKPTDEFVAGATLSYGRFNTVDLQGYVGGPLADTLNYRVAVRTLQSGPWQESYTRPDEWGKQNLVQGRAALEWSPDEKFTALLTLSGFIDKGDTQMPALYAIAPLSPTAVPDPRIGVAPFNQFGRTGGSHYPFAPRDNRAADWSACVNDSPFNEPFHSLPGSATPNPPPTTALNCHAADKDNNYFNVSLRMDYDLGGDLTLTSLSSYQKFNRDSYLEGDGTIYQDYENNQRGFIETWTQELRIAGDFGETGNWVVGANYEHDGTFDEFLQTYSGSTANPTAIPGLLVCQELPAIIGIPQVPGISVVPCAAQGVDVLGLLLAGMPVLYSIPLGPTAPSNPQETESYAFFASGEYEISDEFAIEAGVRYTQTTKTSTFCGLDSGDGTWANVSKSIQNLLQVLNGVISAADYLKFGAEPGGLGINVGAGNCATTGPGPLGTPFGIPGGLYHPQAYLNELDEDNVSWKVGVNWKPSDGTLLYANIKQGYKQGAFPTVAASAFVQGFAAVQESLLAYEIGAKVALFEDTLQLNAAVFYYDYKDKQLLGSISDPVFGTLPALVNVPKSHILGFELAAVWQPLEGLRIAPTVNYSYSKVDGCSGEVPASQPTGCKNGHFFAYDPFREAVDLAGQPFPQSPEWQASLDVQYEWQVMDDMTAFVGVNLNYSGEASGGFYNTAPYSTTPPINLYPTDVLKIDSYTLVDLRAGIENDNWSLQLWGRNVTDEYYYYTTVHVNDVLYRYNGNPATYGFTIGYTF